ncbi:MAG: PAS domain S-box protein [Melioribacteraceae bacterium]
MRNLVVNKNYFKKPLGLISLVFVIFTIILIAVGYYIYQSQKTTFVNSRFNYLTTIADFRKAQITDWLNGRLAYLELLRTNSPLVSLLGKVESDSEDSNNWYTKLKYFLPSESITLIDDSGKIKYRYPEQNIQPDSADSALCSRSIKSNSIIIHANNNYGDSLKQLKFYVPLRNSNISSSKALIISVNSEKIFDGILNNKIYPFQTLESLLVMPDDERIFYLNTPKNSMETQNSKSEYPRKPLINAAKIKDRNGFVDAIDYKNEKVIAVIRSVGHTNWSLITKITKSEFYERVDDLGKMVVLAIITLDLLFAAALLFIWRKNILSNYKKVFVTEIERLKSESRFETLLKEVKGYVIVVLDLEGRIVSWNQGIEAIIGYKENEILGKHFSLFYLEEDRKSVNLENSLKYAAEKGSYEQEGWRLRKDGTKFWANVVIAPLKDNEDKIYGYLKVSHDLSDKKMSEETIKSSRDFYLKLLNGFPTPVWLSGLDGKCNYFNEAWLKFTGRTLEEELGDGWAVNLHPEDRDFVLSTYRDSFSQMKSYSIEYRLKNSQGEYRWMVVVGIPYFDMNNSFAGYLGSCYDINDRKKYEETINSLLRISEKLYSSLEIDQILDSLVVESIKLVDAESGFAAIIDGDKFLTKRYYHQDHWEYSKLSWELDSSICVQFRDRKEGYITNNAESDPLIHPELKSKYAISQLISVPLFGSNGELLGFFEAHNKKNKTGYKPSDLNHVKALAHNASISLIKSLSIEQLRKTELQLRTSESELRQLAAQLQYARETERHHLAREVHDELGQLFTGINLNVLYLRDSIEQKKVELSSQRIISELNEVKKMVDKGIQSVRDISEGLRSYVLEHLGLVQAIKEYCKEFQRMSNIRCNITSYAEDINLSEEKSVALYRIVQESLTNAMRHSKATEIKINFSRKNDFIEVTIEDNGIGFDDKNPRQVKTFGILGMKERALYLNGSLTITSKAGSGTAIKASIPLIEATSIEKIS